MLRTYPKTDNLPVIVMGLCPLLLVTTSILNAIFMGSIFLTVLLLSGVVLSPMRYFVTPAMRLPIILLVTAGCATLIDLLLSVFYYKWHLTLGIYIPLLSMNCLILVNAEENILRHGLRDAMTRSLMLGFNMIGLLFLVGLIRDTMSGSIFNGNGLLIFEMVPGAFLALGLIIALFNYLNTSVAKFCD